MKALTLITLYCLTGIGAESSCILERPFQSHFRKSSTFPTREDGQDENDLWSFKSRPDIRAPKWEVEILDEDALAPGYWFVAPYAKLKQIEYPLWNGPHIFDSTGELVWSGVSMFNHSNVFDFRTYLVNDELKLSLLYPQDQFNAGVILNKNYEIETMLNLGDRGANNMHDFVIINDGRHALTLDAIPGNSTRAESMAVGFDGECCAGWEGFKELNVASSEILYDWDAHGRIGLNESTRIRASYEEMCTECWDILHLNSIDKFPDGDYLISSRHTDTIYKISHKTKSIVWRLGGVKSDFEIDNGATFTRQHHARVQSQNQTHVGLSLFNNAIGNGKGEEKSSDWSSGLLLSLNTETMTAHLLQRYDHPDHKLVVSRGSLEFLPNGNAFLSWTIRTLLSEHSHNGTMLMKARLAIKGANNYRAFKLPWTGMPLSPPDVFVSSNDDKMFQSGSEKHLDVYVSWNGNTEVATWRLYETDQKGVDRKLLTSAPRQGFETKLQHDGNATFVVVEGVHKDGKFLGISDVKIVSQQLSTERHGGSMFAVLTVLGATTLSIVAGIWWRRRSSKSIWSYIRRGNLQPCVSDGREEDAWIETHLLGSDISDNDDGGEIVK